MSSNQPTLNDLKLDSRQWYENNRLWTDCSEKSLSDNQYLKPFLWFDYCYNTIDQLSTLSGDFINKQGDITPTGDKFLTYLNNQHFTADQQWKMRWIIAHIEAVQWILKGSNKGASSLPQEDIQILAKQCGIPFVSMYQLLQRLNPNTNSPSTVNQPTANINIPALLYSKFDQGYVANIFLAKMPQDWGELYHDPGQCFLKIKADFLQAAQYAWQRINNDVESNIGQSNVRWHLPADGMRTKQLIQGRSACAAIALGLLLLDPVDPELLAFKQMWVNDQTIRFAISADIEAGTGHVIELRSVNPKSINMKLSAAKDKGIKVVMVAYEQAGIAEEYLCENDECQVLKVKTLGEAIKQLTAYYAQQQQKQQARQTELYKGNPFSGLNKITEPLLFWGRDDKVAELNALFQKYRLIAVIGHSGSGKSSLVHAGLLADKPQWTVFTPGQSECDPFRSFAEATKKFPRLSSRWLATKIEDCKYDLLDSKLASATSANFIFFIDQFEELFTLVENDLALSFIKFLQHLIQHPNVQIIITFRSDFAQQNAECKELTDLMNMDISKEYLLPPLDASIQQRIAMLTEPGKHTQPRLDVSPALAQQIINDYGRDTGSLALTTFVIEHLYQTKKQACIKHGKQITDLTWEDYQQYRNKGTLADAISNVVEITWKKYVEDDLRSPFDPETMHDTLNRLFYYLVEFEVAVAAEFKYQPARRYIAKAALPKPLHLGVEVLLQARVLLQKPEDGTIALAHETLFDHWSALEQWKQNNRADIILCQRLEVAAQNRQRNPNYPFWRHEREQAVLNALKRLNKLDKIEESHITVEAVIKALERLETPIQALSPAAAAFLAKPEAERLLDELKIVATTDIGRLQIGQRLAVIGDPRKGVGLDAHGIPEIEWCEIPPSEEKVIVEELGAKEVKKFRMAKYLTTWLQFEAFVNAADGYANPNWWRGFEDEQRSTPPQRLEGRFDNEPVTNITWYEATAYCRWLSDKLNQTIDLPDEWQWQHAAYGGFSDRMYPWSGVWQPGRANTSESGLKQVTSVGIFIAGKSEQGCYDMCGNVDEWCRNHYDETSERRVVRGGSYWNHQDYARVASRYDRTLSYHLDYIGFRVCCVSPN